MALDRVRALCASVARLLGVSGRSESETAAAATRGELPANFGAIVLNGLFFPTAGKILGAGLLLAWFLDQLGASTFVIGLLIPIQYGVALLAQPWIGQWISGQARRVPYYRSQALLRGVLWCGLGAVVWSADASARALLFTIFFVVIVLDAIAAGVGNIAFNDALARVIPEKWRGRARGGRGMAGALVAGAAGMLIALFVSPRSGLAVFALLFAISGICYALGGLTFATIREAPRRQSRDRSVGPEQLWPRVQALLAGRNYRRFLLLQTLLIPATQGLVFFSLFGRREFGLNLKALGILLLSDAAAPLAGNYLWGKLADRNGNRWVMGAAAMVSLLAPLLALLLHFLHVANGGGLILTLFALIVFALGLAGVGSDLASKNFLLALAPERTRAVYIGVNDTLIAFPTMLLAAGGLVIDWFGFVPVFVALAVCALAGALLAASLEEEGQGRA